MFACPEVGCTQVFSSERGLAIHRHNCAFVEEGIGTSASEALKKTCQLDIPEEQDFPTIIFLYNTLFYYLYPVTDDE